MPISEQTFLRVAAEDPEGKWELRNGRLCAKPGGCAEHNDAMTTLALAIGRQIEPQEFRLRISSTYVQLDESNYYLPDVLIVPTPLFRAELERSREPEVYETLLPLVVEACEGLDDRGWDAKLARYQAHGDREIWRLHLFERTLTTWRRQADGTYGADTYRSGIVRVMPLPDVTVDLDALFDFS